MKLFLLNFIIINVNILSVLVSIDCFPQKYFFTFSVRGSLYQGRIKHQNPPTLACIDTKDLNSCRHSLISWFTFKTNLERNLQLKILKEAKNGRKLAAKVFFRLCRAFVSKTNEERQTVKVSQNFPEAILETLQVSNLFVLTR